MAIPAIAPPVRVDAEPVEGWEVLVGDGAPSAGNDCPGLSCKVEFAANAFCVAKVCVEFYMFLVKCNK